MQDTNIYDDPKSVGSSVPQVDPIDAGELPETSRRKYDGMCRELIEQSGKINKANE